MNEEDDMLELLDEDDFGSNSEESDDLELTDESDEESVDSLLELEDPDGEPDPTEESPGIDNPDEEEQVDEPEEEGIVIDIRYIALASVAIVAIIIGVVFLVLPMMADNPPQVTLTPNQAGEDLFLTHAGGDKLEQQYLTVLINGAPVPSDKYLLMGGGTWPWSEGTVMRIDTSGYTKPATVSLTYKPKSIDHFVYGTTVEPTPTPTPTPEPMITPDQQALGNGSPETTSSAMPMVSPGITSNVGTAAGMAQTLPFAPTSVVMNIQPSTGSAPLTVQCADKTNGCIRNRVWNFGDNQTSMYRNPVHIFPYPGTYNVTLDVRFCDPDDDPAVLPVQEVVVNPFIRQDSISQGTGRAKVLAGGKFFFSVKGPGTNIRIGGRDHSLNAGDEVLLTLGSEGSGDISIVSNAILRCNYSNVTLAVNGETVETGTISDINIDRYLQFETANLTIQVIAGRDGAKGLVSAEPVINAAPGQQILFKNVGVDSSGKLLFSVQDSAGYTFRGGIESYEVTTPPPL
ncbi:MAG: PKD domain-containing protein [Methanobacteriota archaeon]